MDLIPCCKQTAPAPVRRAHCHSLSLARVQGRPGVSYTHARSDTQASRTRKMGEILQFAFHRPFSCHAENWSLVWNSPGNKPKWHWDEIIFLKKQKGFNVTYQFYSRSFFILLELDMREKRHHLIWNILFLVYLGKCEIISLHGCFGCITGRYFITLRVRDIRDASKISSFLLV